MNNPNFSAVRNGFLIGVNTYGLISGMWSTSFAFGAFLGPTISGVLYDNFGFRDSTYFVIVLEILIAVMYLAFSRLYKERRRLSDSSELQYLYTSIEKDESSFLVPKSNGYSKLQA